MKNRNHKLTKSLNDQLFWRCYRIERKITAFLTYKVSLVPSWSLMRYYFLIGLIVFSSIPRIIKAEGDSFLPTQTGLHPINPVVETIMRAHDIQQYYSQLSALEFNMDEKDISTLSSIRNATLPTAPNREPQESKKVIVTFYSSTIDQTDSTPFITANGSQVREGIVAANFLPFGVRVKLPELFPDKVFVVEDRMHGRFTNRIDVWVQTREEAIERGVHYTVVEIY